jgi:branched-chain amino acid transport system substrate-binding protein
MRVPAIVGLSLTLVTWLAVSAVADEVIIGAQFPLSGPMASYSGPFLRQGAEIARDRIQSEQLLGPGRTLKLLMEDNAGDRNQAISLMNRFASSDNALAAFGVYGSFLSLPVAPVANDLKIPLLAVATSPAIGQAGPWSFTLLENPNAQLVALGALAVDRLKVHSAALVYDRANDASVRIKDGLASFLTSHGVTVVSADGITAQDTNFAPLATKLANEKIDMLFIESVPSVMANILVQVRQGGLSPDVKILASGQASSPVFFDIAGKAAEGVFYTADYFPELQNDENKALVTAYQKQTSKQPDQNVAWGYGGLLLIARAIKDAGPGADRTKMRDALANLKDIVTPLGNGQFSFDENRMPTYPVLVIRVVDGKPAMY